MKPSNQKQLIAQFFQDYEKSFNLGLSDTSADIGATAAAFSDCFVAASPAGVQCGRNDEQFLEAIPQGYAFYRAAGIFSMKIASTAITLIDALHAMATVSWRCDYKNREGATGNMVFDVTYLLQIIENSCNIFAYITGDDQKAFEEHGLS